MTKFPPIEISCFKAYDVRGTLGDELNVDIAYRIGRAFGQYLQPKQVVVGGDVRLTSEALKNALANGLLDAGVNVIDLGQTGTEEIYFATSHLGIDGGVEVTASHNPLDYNGMKMVGKGSKPIGNDNGLLNIKKLAEAGDFAATSRGTLSQMSLMNEYINHLLGYIDHKNITPLKLLVNAGNGAAGKVIDALEAQFKQLNIPIKLIKIHHQPNGNFPHGIPNPLLPENRQDTIDAVIATGADMGIAWDGDFDRCFLFDETGAFIEGYYIVGLLADAFLQKHKGAKVIHDPRLSWNTIQVVNKAGGKPIQSQTGHTYIKQLMREQDAVYGGEMSAHHYFRDFFYCDSGMIPWLLVAELMCHREATLSSMVKDAVQAFPSPGEINRTVNDADQVMTTILNIYKPHAIAIDYTDGISMDMGNWRFNLRKSNTEPLIRLNLETRGDVELMHLKTAELISLIEV